MTVWQSVALAVGLTLLGCLVTYFYRPRAPKILWGSEVLPILPGPMQGVKIHLDDTSVSEFFLLNIAIRNGGASVGVDNTVRPLRLTLSKDYGICKFVYLSAPTHVTYTSVYDSESRSLEVAIDNFNRGNQLEIFFLCSGAGPGVEISGVFRGMNGEPKRKDISRPRHYAIGIMSFHVMIIAATLWLVFDPNSKYARISGAIVAALYILTLAILITNFAWVVRFKSSQISRISMDAETANKALQMVRDRTQ
jgi:hypothetical protein